MFGRGFTERAFLGQFDFDPTAGLIPTGGEQQYDQTPRCYECSGVPPMMLLPSAGAACQEVDPARCDPNAGAGEAPVEDNARGECGPMCCRIPGTESRPCFTNAGAEGECVVFWNDTSNCASPECVQDGSGGWTHPSCGTPPEEPPDQGCPAGQETLPDGSCADPCPPGEVRNDRREGGCDCPPDTFRNEAGECDYHEEREDCTSFERLDDGTCCPEGEYKILKQCAVGAVACPNGDGTYKIMENLQGNVLSGRVLFERGTLQQAQAYGVHIIHENDGRCTTDVGQLCPNGEPMASDGSCECADPTHTYKPETNTCSPPTCPAGQLVNAAGECIPAEEGEYQWCHDAESDTYTLYSVVNGEITGIIAEGLATPDTRAYVPAPINVPIHGALCDAGYIPDDGAAGDLACPASEGFPRRGAEGVECYPGGNPVYTPSSETGNCMRRETSASGQSSSTNQVDNSCCDEPVLVNPTYNLYDAVTGEHVASDVAEADLPADAVIVAADDDRCGPRAVDQPVDGGIPTGGIPTGGIPTGGIPTGGIPTGGVPMGPAPGPGIPTQKPSGAPQIPAANPFAAKFVPCGSQPPVTIRKLRTETVPGRPDSFTAAWEKY